MSLLNIDYKIVTKVLVNRLGKVLQKIINPHQTGYVKGWILLEKENSADMAVFVDFRKAFKSIDWNYLEKALMLFNFGPNFLQ